uniref:Secreted Odorant Binding Protein Family protein n=1 Tax=Pristhesancus plagipennis TaxID=1955184 RepID=A0A2K8JMP6_PRIPG|nr:secreted Odorant Binding Protein Family protein [Pristhesancus plagipennis]
MNKIIILTAILSMLHCIHSSVISDSLNKDGLRALQKKYIGDCEKEHHVGESELKNFIQTGQVQSEQFKCMLACYGEKNWNY